MPFGAIGGGLINASTASAQRQHEQEEARKAWERSQVSATTAWERSRQAVQQSQAFSLSASGSSYQRGMADLKKAGLNPILAYSKGGASSPLGSMATGPAASGPAAKVPSMQHFAKDFLSGMKLKEEIENIRAMTNSARSAMRLTDTKNIGETANNTGKKIRAEAQQAARDGVGRGSGLWNRTKREFRIQQRRAARKLEERRVRDQRWINENTRFGTKKDRPAVHLTPTYRSK